MTNDEIRDGIYKLIEDNTLDDLNTLKVSYNAVFMGSANIMSRCY